MALTYPVEGIASFFYFLSNLPPRGDPLVRVIQFNATEHVISSSAKLQPFLIASGFLELLRSQRKLKRVTNYLYYLFYRIVESEVLLGFFFSRVLTSSFRTGQRVER